MRQISLGLHPDAKIRIYNGNLCKRCGNTERYINGNNCVECKRKSGTFRRKESSINRRIAIENNSKFYDGWPCKKCGRTKRYVTSCDCVQCKKEKHFELPPDERWAKEAFKGARLRAKKKGLEFSIEISNLIIPKFCPVLGILLEFGKGQCGSISSSPTIDRIDNSKGYTKDNICIISHRANILKRDATPQELDLLAAYAGHRVLNKCDK